MKVGRKLREIVRARIIDQIPDVGGRVIDRATKTTPDPYVTLGPSYSIDSSSECIEARSHTIQIDVWTKGNKGLCEDLTDDISTALKGFSDTTLIAMHPFEISLVRVMDDPDGVSVHGVIQIEVMVEVDPV